MPYTIRRLDLHALPCCPVKGDKAIIPDFPVLYIIFDTAQVFYVGASKSLYKRWNAHRTDHRLSKVLKRKDVKVAWISAQVEQFREFEVALIRFLKPTMNCVISGYHHAGMGKASRRRTNYHPLKHSTNGNGHK